MLEQIEEIGKKINRELQKIEFEKSEKIKEISREWAEKNSETIEHGGKTYTYQERLLIALRERDKIIEKINSVDKKLSSEEIIKMGETLKVLDEFIKKYREAEELIEQRKNEAKIVVAQKREVIRNGINEVIESIEDEIDSLVEERSTGFDFSGDNAAEEHKRLGKLLKREAELRKFREEMTKLLSCNCEINAGAVDASQFKRGIAKIKLPKDYKKVINEFYGAIHAYKLDMTKQPINNKQRYFDQPVNIKPEAFDQSVDIKPEAFDQPVDIKPEAFDQSVDFDNNKKDVHSSAEDEERLLKFEEKFDELLSKVNDKTISFEERRNSLEELEKEFNEYTKTFVSLDSFKYEKHISAAKIALEKEEKAYELKCEEEAKLNKLNSLIDDVTKNDKTYSEILDKFEEMTKISNSLIDTNLKSEKNNKIEELRQKAIKEEIEALEDSCIDQDEFRKIAEKVRELAEQITDEDYKNEILKAIDDGEKLLNYYETIEELTKLVEDKTRSLAARKCSYDELLKQYDKLLDEYEFDQDEKEDMYSKIKEAKKELDEYEKEYNQLESEVDELIEKENLEEYENMLDKIKTLAEIDKKTLEGKLIVFYNKIVAKFDDLLTDCSEKIENNEFIDDSIIALMCKYYIYLPQKIALDYETSFKSVINYYNNSKQTLVKEDYKINKDGLFSSIGKIATFVGGSKIVTKVNSKFLGKLYKNIETIKNEKIKKAAEKVARGIESKLSRKSVVGGLKLFVSQSKLEKLKTKLYKDSEYSKLSGKKQERLLKKQDKALESIEKQMVKGLKTKTSIRPVTQEIATSIVDQYLYLIATASGIDKEGNFDLSKHIEALYKYLEENKDLFTENEYRAIKTQAELINEYRLSRAGEIYQITSGYNENGEFVTELDDVVNYYDNEEELGYRKVPAYVKR